MTCCVCGEDGADCFLQIRKVKGFHHHLRCGHLDGTGTGLTPQMSACVDKLRAYVGLIEVTEDT